MAQSPNVMVEIKLTPSMKKDYLKSDIHEVASNPTFNEQFEFGLTFEEARNQSLLLFLVYMDKFSHPFCVGEITHPLDHLDMEKINSSKEEMIICREIQKRQTVNSVLDNNNKDKEKNEEGEDEDDDEDEDKKRMRMMMRMKNKIWRMRMMIMMMIMIMMIILMMMMMMMMKMKMGMRMMRRG